MDVVAFVVLVVTLAAPLCGHHAEPCPIRIRGAWRGRRRPQAPSRVSGDAGGTSRASQGRSGLSLHHSNPSAPARRPRSTTDHHTPAETANARHTPAQRPSWARKDAA